MIFLLVFIVLSMIVMVEKVVERRTVPHGPGCAKCGYDLRGLGSSGTCPECGIPYTPVRVELKAVLGVHRQRAGRWGIIVLLAVGVLLVASASVDSIEAWSYALQGFRWIDSVKASKVRNDLGVEIYWPLGTLLAVSPLLSLLRWRAFAGALAVGMAGALALSILNCILLPL